MKKIGITYWLDSFETGKYFLMPRVFFIFLQCLLITFVHSIHSTPSPFKAFATCLVVKPKSCGFLLISVAAAYVSPRELKVPLGHCCGQQSFPSPCLGGMRWWLGCALRPGSPKRPAGFWGGPIPAQPGKVGCRGWPSSGAMDPTAPHGWAAPVSACLSAKQHCCVCRVICYSKPKCRCCNRSISKKD